MLNTGHVSRKEHTDLNLQILSVNWLEKVFEVATITLYSITSLASSFSFLFQIPMYYQSILPQSFSLSQETCYILVGSYFFLGTYERKKHVEMC